MGETVRIDFVFEGGSGMRELGRVDRILDGIRTSANATSSAFAGLGRAAFRAGGDIDNAMGRAARSIRQVIDERSRLGLGGGSGGGLGVAGGFLIAQGVQYGLGQIGSAYDAAREGSRAERFLSFQANRSGVGNRAFSDAASLGRDLNLSQANARSVEAQALRLTTILGRPEDASKLVRALADSAVAAGRSLEEIPDLLTQIATGQDEVFDKLLSVNPSTLYERYAKSVGRSAASLNDFEKLQIRVNAVLEEGGRTAGVAAASLDTATGRVDRAILKLQELKRELAELGTIHVGRLLGGEGGLTQASGLLGAGGGAILGGIFGGYKGAAAGAALGSLAPNIAEAIQTNSFTFAEALAAQFGSRNTIYSRYEDPAVLAASRATYERRGLADREALANYRPRGLRPSDDQLSSEELAARRADLAGLRERGNQALGQYSAQQAAEAKANADAFRAAGQELAALKNQFAGANNPFVAIAEAGRLANERLKRDYAEFPALIAQLTREQNRLTQREAAGQIASSLSAASDYGARAREFSTAYAPDGSVHSPNAPYVPGSFRRETDAERAVRGIADSRQIAQTVSGYLDPNLFSAEERQQIAERLQREAVIEASRGLDPNANIGPNARAAIVAAYSAAQADKLKQVADEITRTKAAEATAANTKAAADALGAVGKFFADIVKGGTTANEALKNLMKLGLTVDVKGAELRNASVFGNGTVRRGTAGGR